VHNCDTVERAVTIVFDDAGTRTILVSVPLQPDETLQYTDIHGWEIPETLTASGLLPITGPAGSTTQVQFNDAGAFGGDPGFVYDQITGSATSAA
jgi:hypothetical protein